MYRRGLLSNKEDLSRVEIGGLIIHEGDPDGSGLKFMREF